MTITNIPQSVRSRYLNVKDEQTLIAESFERSKHRTAAVEKKGLKTLGEFGSFFFPLIVILFSGFGLGEIAETVIPAIPAYISSFGLAIVIEYGQFEMVRPLTRMIAFEQKITLGDKARGLFFTFFSIALGMVGFWFIALKQGEQKQTDFKAKYAQVADSLTSEKNKKLALVETQIIQLTKAQTKRWGYVLTPQETEMQANLNNEASKLDSTYKSETTAAKIQYNIDQPERPQKFSLVEFTKWAIAFFVVLLIGFMSCYCHYMYSLYDYLVNKQGSELMGVKVNEELSINHATETYGAAVNILPRSNFSFTPFAYAQHQQRQQTTQPAASTQQRIGFRFGTNATVENTPNAADVGGYVGGYGETPSHAAQLLGEAECPYCHSIFIKKTWNQIYCNKDVVGADGVVRRGNNECRKAADYERNGVYNGRHE